MTFLLSRVSTYSIIATTALFLFCSAGRISAQSTDVRFPTGVSGSEIVGAIPARDIGDGRLTDHFYTFNGLPGDLLITVQSRNLNGDFDVFTASELRPVVKVTVFAESTSAITKDIYLRKSESLILRVEARSPNDDAGSYTIRFSGSFDAVVLPESTKPNDASGAQSGKSADRRTTRVSSVGARIEEPAAEVATKPTPEPTPAATGESPTTAPKKTVAANRGPRRPRSRPTPTKVPVKPAPPEVTSSATASSKAGTVDTPAETVPAKTETEAKPETGSESNPKAEVATKAETTATANNPPADRKTAARSRKPPRAAAPENTQHLLIEVKDGTRLEYLMSNVRRVTVENGVVVILGKQGDVRRVPMSTIVRMSIGP